LHPCVAGKHFFGSAIFPVLIFPAAQLLAAFASAMAAPAYQQHDGLLAFETNYCICCFVALAAHMHQPFD